MRLEFELPIYIEGKGKRKTMLGMNWYRNVHFFKSNDVKKSYKEIVEEKLKGSKIKLKDYQIEYKLFYKVDSCDMMNIIAVVDKFLQDSLQELGIVENDNVQHCKKVMCEVREQDKINPRVCVTISTFK